MDDVTVVCVTYLALNDQPAMSTLLRGRWPPPSETGPHVLHRPVSLQCEGFPQSSEYIEVEVEEGDGGRLQPSW